MKDNIKIENKGNAERDINIAGRDIHHNYPSKKERLQLPLRGASNFFLDVAKDYWKFIEQGKKQFSFGVLVPSIISLLLIGNYSFTKLFSQMINLTLFSIGLIVAVILFSLVTIRFTTNCNQCKESFAMKEIKRELIKEKRVGDKLIRNMEVTRGCRYCHKKEKPYLDIDEEEISENGR